MPMTSEGQLTVEKTPSYLITTNVADRVRMMSKDVRLIVVLRDPVTRALSDYTQTSFKKRRAKPTFEQLAFVDESDDDNATTLSTTATAVNTSWRAIQIGLYAVHVRRWLEHFRADQLYFVSGEQLVSNPAGVLASVQDFLRLRRVVTDKHFRFSREKGFPCVVRDPQHSPNNVHCLGKTKGRRHPVIEPSSLKRLRDFFRPHNEDLYRLTNINFGWP